MPIGVRGTTPLVTVTTGNPVSGTLTGARQPQTGDLIVIFHGNDYYALSNMPTPTVGGSTTGVTAITNGSADAGNPDAHVKTYWYPVSSTGDVTVAVTETGSADEEKMLVVWVLSSADTTSPIDGGTGGAAGSFANTGQVTLVMNGVSPASSGALLLTHLNSGGGSSGGTPYGSPGGAYTELYDSSFGGISYVGGCEQLSASGATGTRTFNGLGATTWAGVMVAIAPNAGPGFPTDVAYPRRRGNIPPVRGPAGRYAFRRRGALDVPEVLGTNAPAEEAVTAYTAQDPSVTTTATGDQATIGYAAPDAQGSVGANAEQAATVWYTAADASPDISATGGTATTGYTAPDASGSTSVTADQATTVGYTAADAQGSVGASPTTATAAYTAADASLSSAANADQATAAFTAPDASTSISPTAEQATTVTYAAFDATVSTAVTVNAPAEVATFTYTAYDTSTSVSAAGTGVATSAYTADDPSPSVGVPAAPAATVGYTAYDATVQTEHVTPAEQATAVGWSAYDAGVTAAATAGTTTTGYAAYNATVQALSAFTPYRDLDSQAVIAVTSDGVASLSGGVESSATVTGEVE